MMLSPVIEPTMSMCVEDTSIATDTQPCEIQESSTQHNYEKQKPKRTLNESYENVQDIADSQVKKKKMEMCSVSDMKLKIYKTDLKLQEEELAARRRKYGFEKEEFRLRKRKQDLEEKQSMLKKAILKTELEIAKAKLEKYSFV